MPVETNPFDAAVDREARESRASFQEATNQDLKELLEAIAILVNNVQSTLDDGVTGKTV